MRRNERAPSDHSGDAAAVVGTRVNVALRLESDGRVPRRSGECGLVGPRPCEHRLGGVRPHRRTTDAHKNKPRSFDQVVRAEHDSSSHADDRKVPMPASNLHERGAGSPGEPR